MSTELIVIIVIGVATPIAWWLFDISKRMGRIESILEAIQATNAEHRNTHAEHRALHTSKKT